MYRRAWVLVLAFLVEAAACGGGKTAVPTRGQTGTPPATCTPSGTSLEVTAEDIKFDKDCLAAPANQVFTIRFKNKDFHVIHNVAIYSEDRRVSRATAPLFKGSFIFGPKTITYKVTRLPAGRFYFHCDTHPFTMVGIFIAS